MTPSLSHTSQRPRVVIIGAGFGGLEAAKKLGGKPVDVTLIDRNNYHGFWPLLYQVATAGLEPQQIAQPVRAITRRLPNVEFRVAAVRDVDREHKLVHTDRGDFPYDDLIVAAGSATNFFGLDEVEQHGFELKDVPDALALRNHVIACFERVVSSTDPAEIERLLTFVVVGGGPTGVELAGAIAELVRHVLRKDYPMLDFSKVRVLLLEAMDRLLLAFPPSLARKAHQKLEKLGVEVRLKTSVTGYDRERLSLKDDSSLPTETVIWAAGVQGAPLGQQLSEKLERGNRIEVTPTLQLPDDPCIWVIGDLAYLPGPDGKPYPQLATVAMQQGRLAGQNLLNKLRGAALQPFQYTDKGTMATVGRRFAVARIWRTNWSGPIAWLLWLAVHLFYLIGFRNRLIVLINWAYNYFTYDRGSRALVEYTPLLAPETKSTTPAGETVNALERAAKI